MAENEAERRQWQTLLAKVETDLDELEKKSIPLRNMRTYLRGLLGLPIEEKAKAPAVSEMQAHTGTLPKFRKGDFYGLSQAEAGYRVLARAGGSLTTEEILSVLTESGYEIGGQEPKRTLYSSLCRSRKLVLVAENTFDLAERRPQAKRLRRTHKEEKVQSEGKAQSVSESEKEK